MKKFTILILVACCFFSFSPTINYKAHYSEDYENAVQFLKDNKNIFNKASRTYGIEEKALKAVVFPELMRYNLLQNLIETEALELLYIQAGSKQIDFSIGNFQMKPSFV